MALSERKWREEEQEEAGEGDGEKGEGKGREGGRKNKNKREKVMGRRGKGREGICMVSCGKRNCSSYFARIFQSVMSCFKLVRRPNTAISHINTIKYSFFLMAERFVCRISITKHFPQPVPAFLPHSLTSAWSVTQTAAPWSVSAYLSLPLSLSHPLSLYYSLSVYLSLFLYIYLFIYLSHPGGGS